MSFCSQPHQIVDWTQLGHKTQCPTYASLRQENSNDYEKLIEQWTRDEIVTRRFNKHAHGFPEREIFIEPEVLEVKQKNKKKDPKYDEKSSINET